VDINLALQNDVEVVSGFILAEDYRSIDSDPFATVCSEPMVFVIRKSLQRLDAAQGHHDLGYRSGVYRWRRLGLAASWRKIDNANCGLGPVRRRLPDDL
jgi:hypothetical protein